MRLMGGYLKNTRLHRFQNKIAAEYNKLSTELENEYPIPKVSLKL